ncbi:MAG: 6-phospho-3-hexuloisomerase [Sphaerochaetaceae bacterium]|nr:6-phospho-3-hexuloisomerase [Sphaerochaetaceae bacterium]
MKQNYRNRITAVTEELTMTLEGIRGEEADSLVRAISTAQKIFVAGAGRSGFMMKAFCMRLMHLGFDAYVVGETISPNITERDLLIIGSGSGGTASLVTMAEKAHSIGAIVSLVTVTADSQIGLIADPIIHIPAISPKVDTDNEFFSIQPMGSLFEQSLLIFLDTVILLLMDTMIRDSGSMFSRHANLE